MTGVGSAVLDWLTGGSALAALGKVLAAVCVLVFGLVYRRYLGILGADRRRPAERQAYDTLRASLAEGNLAARLYAQRLARFLDWIDRFFGDAGMADRTLFPNAFWLRTPVPLWTAPALDRCLLLATFYPIATILVIWGVSGHIGPAEATLQLSHDLHAGQRALFFTGIGSLTVPAWLAMRTKSFGWFSLAVVVAAAAVVSGSGAYAVVLAATMAVAGSFIVSDRATGAVVGSCVVIFALALSLILTSLTSGSLIFTYVVFLVVVLGLPGGAALLIIVLGGGSGPATGAFILFLFFAIGLIISAGPLLVYLPLLLSSPLFQPWSP